MWVVGESSLCPGTIFEQLQQYEHEAVDFYSGGDKKQRVIVNEGMDYEQVMDEMPTRLENPYKLISEWLRMEIYDLEGLRESIEGVRHIEKTI
jgi:hypothetical protein